MSNPAWHDLYKDALLEVDPIRLPARIECARRAIHTRIVQNQESISERERDDIDNALRFLHVLVREAA